MVGREHADPGERRVDEAFGAAPRIGGGRRRHDDDEAEPFAGITFEFGQRRAHLDRCEQLERVRCDVGAAKVDPTTGHEPSRQPHAVSADRQTACDRDRPLEDIGVGVGDG